MTAQLISLYGLNRTIIGLKDLDKAAALTPSSSFESNYYRIESTLKRNNESSLIFSLNRTIIGLKE